MRSAVSYFYRFAERHIDGETSAVSSAADVQATSPCYSPICSLVTTPLSASRRCRTCCARRPRPCRTITLSIAARRRANPSPNPNPTLALTLTLTLTLTHLMSGIQ